MMASPTMGVCSRTRLRTAVQSCTRRAAFLERGVMGFPGGVREAIRSPLTFLRTSLDEPGELLGDGAPAVVEAHLLVHASIGGVLVHPVRHVVGAERMV